MLVSLVSCRSSLIGTLGLGLILYFGRRIAERNSFYKSRCELDGSKGNMQDKKRWWACLSNTGKHANAYGSLVGAKEGLAAFFSLFLYFCLGWTRFTCYIQLASWPVFLIMGVHFWRRFGSDYTLLEPVFFFSLPFAPFFLFVIKSSLFYSSI